MSKKYFLLVVLAFTCLWVNAQTDEELKATKAEKEAEVAALEGQVATLKGEIAAIDKQLVILPRWETGAFGVIGLDINRFNDWLGRGAQSNTSSANISVALNGKANLFTEKSFWRNAVNVNMGWIKFDDKNDPDDDDDFKNSADAINLTSLYGYKLSDKIAISTLGEYRSTILDNFNNPGYLDVGVGATWTPLTNLVVVVHPLNYNFVFSDGDATYQNSLGAKIVGDYTAEIAKGVNWKSNLSIFMSYEDVENLSNWTWINGLGFNVWKGIGVGLELGLRKNKQEALAAELTDNPLQMYYILGLSYSIGSK